MKVKTYEAQYELIEFNLYIDHSKEDAINVADLVIESDDLEFIEKHDRSSQIPNPKQEKT